MELQLLLSLHYLEHLSGLLKDAMVGADAVKEATIASHVTKNNK
ncbi:MAG: hypothetical protein PUA56_00755 [Bacillales bacterium]|nr:hypothetical protein [Bacillales bacterium]